MEYAAVDLLSDPPRAKLRVVSSNVTLEAPDTRPRLSLETRTIVIRDHGFRQFRVF